MPGHEHPETPLIVPLEDTHDARHFIELSSIAADLADARRAAEHALVAGDDSFLAEVRATLIGYATVAYCRTIPHSNVRRPLTYFVELTEQEQRISDLVKGFRNTTVAHSQSELWTTHAVGVLDPRTLQVQDVLATAVTITLARSLVEEFVLLLTAVEERLEAVIAPVRDRLRSKLAATDPDELRRRVAAGLPVEDRPVAEFDPRSQRRRRRP
ncbi:MAG: hypothetical protein U0R80_00635 [Nocardioidaceae bacterium]